MKIDKITKKMTREEFLNSIVCNEGGGLVEFLGERDKCFCPSDYELKECCDKGVHCKNDCWIKAIENIKFKGEEEMKESFECIKDFYMRDKTKAFSKGKTYEVINSTGEYVAFDIDDMAMKSHWMDGKSLEEYFKKVTPITEKEVTLEEEKKEYTIQEVFEFPVGTEFTSKKTTTKFVIKKDGEAKTLFLKKDNEACNLTDLWMQYKFTLVEKEYMTFDEARKTNQNFKYKDWDFGYLTLLGVLRELNEITEGYSLKEKDKLDYYNNIMDEKSWEIES